MSSAISSALSGMRAAENAIAVAGHNIANAATAGFHRQEAVQATAAEGGVTTSVRRSTTEGASLETDIVGQLQAKNGFMANMAVFRTHYRLVGSLLNAVG